MSIGLMKFDGDKAIKSEEDNNQTVMWIVVSKLCDYDNGSLSIGIYKSFFLAKFFLETVGTFQ